VDDPQWASRWKITSLPDSSRAATRVEVGELLLLLARARGQEDGGAGEGLELNRRAEACFDEVPGVLYAQRVWLRCRAGLPDEPSQETRPSLSARDRYLEAQELFAGGEYLEALRLLELAVVQEPDHYWVRFLLGICCDRLGRDPQAETCYTVCIALMPDFHPAFFNRGLARHRQKKYDLA
jgi:tetratricopeptide (TPR) repeat protein